MMNTLFQILHLRQIRENDFFMSMFGHEWSEDYDAMEEYETSILHHDD